MKIDEQEDTQEESNKTTKVMTITFIIIILSTATGNETWQSAGA